MTGIPSDIANQALDAIGSDVVLGDIEDGSREAQVILRAYGQVIRQLLRSANWNFAGKVEPMTLLADASGATPTAGTQTLMNALYEYAYPVDCVRARFVLYPPTTTSTGTPSGNITTGSVAPISTALLGGYGTPLFKARFKLANDPNYPPVPGQQWWDVSGLSPTGRLVVLTNAPNALLSYTAFIPYPSMWDALFREAVVAALASRIALPLTKDRKFGLVIRREQLAIAKDAIERARVVDGNENPSSSDIPVDWLRSRNSGYGWGAPPVGNGQAQSGYNSGLWSSQFALGSFSTDFDLSFG